MKILLLLLLLLLLALSSSSLGADVTLSSVDDFIDFVNSVNSGSDYSGTTVYLNSDITLSGKIDPIGSDTSNYFLGVFDGQGHIISDPQMNSSSQYIGLFGYSEGLTIRNVVLDSSCSITSSFESSSYAGSAYIGGIIGCCYAISDGCIIESNVNMADVSFSGNISGNMFIGGIVGYLYSSSSSYSVYVKNCVNYGSVTHSGAVNDGWYAEIGGIVGISYGSSSYQYVQNCLNYGTITHNGTSSRLVIGGIVGNSASYTYIENCVSAGKISIQTTASSINRVGSITGQVVSGIHINYCYFTGDVNVNSIYGYASSTPSTTGTPNSPTDVNSGLVSKLNANATSCNWDKWFMLHLNGGRINNLTQELLIEIQGHIPNPVKEGNSFLFWCKDAECTEAFDPETESVSGTTALYALWAPNNYIVTFDFGNRTTVNVTFTYNTEIIYPETKKEGYTLSWGNYHKLMPARDITVTALWTPNNYTVTFDFNYDGSVSDASKIVTFDEEYGGLPGLNRAGYMLIGWFTDAINGTEVTTETIVTTPYNHTLYAHWEEVTNYVEIVFNTKDLTQEDVKELIEQYTKAEFEVIRFEEESEEIRTIVKFADKEDAENFIESIKGSSEMENIKKIGFDKGDYNSFSTMVHPLLFLNTLFL